MNTMKKLLILPILISANLIFAQHTIEFGVELSEVTDTEKIYDFVFDDFVNIVGWQFNMNFDGSKMSFKEIRNPILEGLSSNSFNEPQSGDLISVWLDFDLVPEDFTESTVAFQIVFDLIEGDGSDLCFETSQDFYEFIVNDEMGNFYLSELVIYDDCNQGMSILFETTSTQEAEQTFEVLTDVFLSASGTLAFTAQQATYLSFSLRDMQGKAVFTVRDIEIREGRQTVHAEALPPGMYVLSATTKTGEIQSIKLVVQ